MKDIINILKNVGAIIPDSHFVGTSCRHMPAYINKDALTSHTKHTSEVGKLFAEKFKNKNIEVVVAPAVAGIPLSQWTAYHLSKISGKEVLSVFTEKTPENNQVLKRGYDVLVKNKRALVVEDITTTGSSVKKVVKSVKKAKGKVIAVCVMVNRDPKLVNSKSVGAPFSSLGVFKIPSYDEKECPLCKNNIPINIEFGHGKEFLAEKNLSPTPLLTGEGRRGEVNYYDD
jgi:orotate phosphoribosyltransferase